MKKRYIFAVLSLVMMLVVAGCNTAKGFGEDLETGGKAIQNAAHD